MRVRQTIAAAVAAATLATGVVALAAPAGAATTTTPKTALCRWAHHRYQELKEQNRRAVAEYRRLRALQRALVAQGHPEAAARLDAKLDAAKVKHDQAVARVIEIRNRVRDKCGEGYPDLPPVS